ncbi:MAG: hypothetical protein JJU20_13915, partial [Opitutales bacterium]|nr:hypothetical protein [Opitutales bacterium]
MPEGIRSMDDFWTATESEWANHPIPVDLELDVLYQDIHWNVMWAADGDNIHYVQESNAFLEESYSGKR